jgi:hypothetical protein
MNSSREKEKKEKHQALKLENNICFLNYQPIIKNKETHNFVYLNLIFNYQYLKLTLVPIIRFLKTLIIRCFLDCVYLLLMTVLIFYFKNKSSNPY